MLPEKERIMTEGSNWLETLPDKCSLRSQSSQVASYLCLPWEVGWVPLNLPDLQNVSVHDPEYKEGRGLGP